MAEPLLLLSDFDGITVFVLHVGLGCIVTARLPQPLVGLLAEVVVIRYTLQQQQKQQQMHHQESRIMAFTSALAMCCLQLNTRELGQAVNSEGK